MRKSINWTYVVTVAVVHLFMVGAAAISFSHIVDVSTTLGLTWEAWTVPFFIDGLAILGKVGRSDRFAAKTQRAGLGLMAGAGVLSLAANVMAGNNLGQQLYGVLVVAGFVTTEWYSAKLKPAPVAPAAGRKLDPQVAAERAAKASTTKAQRKLEREAAAEAQRWASLTPAQRGAETRARRATAPVSPAVVSG